MQESEETNEVDSVILELGINDCMASTDDSALEPVN